MSQNIVILNQEDTKENMILVSSLFKYSDINAYCSNLLVQCIQQE